MMLRLKKVKDILLSDASPSLGRLILDDQESARVCNPPALRIEYVRLDNQDGDIRLTPAQRYMVYSMSQRASKS